MVINGGSRSGSPAYAAWLSAHLARTDSNERVYVRRLDGVAADDLAGALLEMSAVASGARSKRGLYHANIDWRHDEQLNDVQKDRAVHRLAEELGLAGQPCVVVEHVKDGREHLHAVWMRIDTQTMTAISDAHNYRRHEIVARDLEREFDLARVQGVHVERDGIERPARTPEAYEFAQAARTGLTAAEAKAEITTLWNQADSGRAFTDALDDAEWTLARGDKRDFVVVDQHGEAHSLARRVDGVKAAQIRARMAGIDPAGLPSVDEARQAVRDRQRDKVAVPEMDSPAFSQPEPPPDLDARFGPGPEIDPDARMVPDPVPTPAHQLTERDELAAENRPQHRQAQSHQVQSSEPDGPRRREPEQEPSQSPADNDGRRAMEELARTDPLGMAARHGFHVGDHLKTPEDMRREMAERLRSFAVPPAEPTPEPMPWGRLLRTLAEADARKPEAPAPELGVTDLPTPSQEAPQRLSYEASPEPHTAKPDRLARIIAAARARLTALGERLDVAFGRIRDQLLKPDPEVSHAMPRTPESGPINAKLAADLRSEPKPAPLVDEDRAREIQRQIEAGRKAGTYDRDRMRDLSREHYELIPTALNRDL